MAVYWGLRLGFYLGGLRLARRPRLVGFEMKPYAIMAVDPGGVTGVARGLFDLSDGLELVNRRLARDVVAEAVALGEVQAAEATGPYWEQAYLIAEEFLYWRGELLTRFEEFELDLVIEGFQLRTQLAELSPVEVTAGIVTLLSKGSLVGGPWSSSDVVYQEPAQAKRVTRVRMVDTGLWDLGKGSEHKRDALRHLLVRVSKVLG